MFEAERLRDTIHTINVLHVALYQSEIKLRSSGNIVPAGRSKCSQVSRGLLAYLHASDKVSPRSAEIRNQTQNCIVGMLQTCETYTKPEKAISLKS